MAIKQLQQGIDFLANAGLNLYAAFDCVTLPKKISGMMEETAVPLKDYSRIVILGHGGRRLWDAMTEDDRQQSDPVDSYSIRIAQTFIDQTLSSFNNLILYPNHDYLVPLQQLGEMAGWCHPSPLGLGISPQFGLWFAYRVAFLTNAPLPISANSIESSPCNSCQTKLCIQACPAQAVGVIGQFHLTNCANHRVLSQSTCADRCLARMACPIAPEHRYSFQQIQYHYKHSLDSIKNYTA